jgi:hypothetical protein
VILKRLVRNYRYGFALSTKDPKTWTYSLHRNQRIYQAQQLPAEESANLAIERLPIKTGRLQMPNIWAVNACSLPVATLVQRPIPGIIIQ